MWKLNHLNLRALEGLNVVGDSHRRINPQTHMPHSAVKSASRHRSSDIGICTLAAAVRSEDLSCVIKIRLEFLTSRCDF
jgi:hypothetical protein